MHMYCQAVEAFSRFAAYRPPIAIAAPHEGSSPTFVAPAIVLIGLLALLVWGFWNRWVWRILAVLGMGAGVGVLVWGIMLAAMHESPPLGSAAGITQTPTLIVIRQKDGKRYTFGGVPPDYNLFRDFVAVDLAK